ncbi:MAG: ABC transporter ATP-binding protein [Gemmatimonadales bacterium]
MNIFELQNVTKRFERVVALDSVTLAVPRRSIIGLLGRNGSGKTTLLRHVTGLHLPTSGRCETFGVRTDSLGPRELSRLGMVSQRDYFIDWMRIKQLLRYVGSFYPIWDRVLEKNLVESLDLDLSATVGTLSPGNAQKLALVLATCHHPELLLLDEPLSDMDPIARAQVVQMLLDRFNDDDLTMVISSHMLQDIEVIVERVVCLDHGRVITDAPIDELRQRFGGLSLEAIFPLLVGDETPDDDSPAKGDDLREAHG